MSDTCPQCGEEYKSVGGHMSRSSSCELTEEVLIEELERLADELGGVVGKRDMNECGKFSERPYKGAFGSWSNALKEAELEPNVKRNVGEGRLLDEIHRLADELGKTPSQRDMNECGKFGQTVYYDNFGSWNAALKEAGLEINLGHYIGNYIGKDKLLDELQQLADELGKTPSTSDMKENGQFSWATYANNFGSWNAALRAAGFDPIQEYPIEPEWADDVEDYYGESWPQKREEAVERDDHECQVCGDDGLLHVHHITPRRMFGYPDDSNTLDNLVTLCAPCHGNFEGHWVGADVEAFVENARDAYGFAEESGVQTELREPILV